MRTTGPERKGATYGREDEGRVVEGKTRLTSKTVEPKGLLTGGVPPMQCVRKPEAVARDHHSSTRSCSGSECLAHTVWHTGRGHGRQGGRQRAKTA